MLNGIATSEQRELVERASYEARGVVSVSQAIMNAFIQLFQSQAGHDLGVKIDMKSEGEYVVYSPFGEARANISTQVGEQGIEGVIDFRKMCIDQYNRTCWRSAWQLRVVPGRYFAGNDSVSHSLDHLRGANLYSVGTTILYAIGRIPLYCES